jgi:hypothetical protein
LEATLEIRRVPLASLHADPANARAHDERNLDAIRGSLERFRQVEPLVVQRSTGRVVGGNGRLVAMKAMGWTECDIVELDLDDVQATALGIALNRTSDLAAWDLPALGKLLDSLRAEDALDGVGFCAKQFERSRPASARQPSSTAAAWGSSYDASRIASSGASSSSAPATAVRACCGRSSLAPRHLPHLILLPRVENLVFLPPTGVRARGRARARARMKWLKPGARGAQVRVSRTRR